MNYIENPFDCPVTRTMSLIGGKWKPIILNILGMGTIRFGKLNHMIPAISNKMLSSELKQLEELQLIERLVYKEIPPRVEYQLTETGKSLLPILYAMADWGNSEIAKELLASEK
jgi:DNA-binding HxlR family transcriptional regulator